MFIQHNLGHKYNCVVLNAVGLDAYLCMRGYASVGSKTSQTSD